jgi:hypothetical protein
MLLYTDMLLYTHRPIFETIKLHGAFTKCRSVLETTQFQLHKPIITGNYCGLPQSTQFQLQKLIVAGNCCGLPQSTQFQLHKPIKTGNSCGLPQSFPTNVSTDMIASSKISITSVIQHNTFCD